MCSKCVYNGLTECVLSVFKRRLKCVEPVDFREGFLDRSMCSPFLKWRRILLLECLKCVLNAFTMFLQNAPYVRFGTLLLILISGAAFRYGKKGVRSVRYLKRRRILCLKYVLRASNCLKYV